MSDHAADGSVPHGGDLGAARRLFPDAPQPFLDLSTGINPDPYPMPPLDAESFARLPNVSSSLSLAAAAAAAYGAPTPESVVAAPGTQVLLALAARMAPTGRAAILSPTYGEFARVAALAGHSVSEVKKIGELAGAELSILANPNNPDGRLRDKEALLALAAKLRRRGGILVVDEAFMDVGPAEASLAGEVASGGIVVLRSFGKFFGLAGVRLSFALTAPPLAAKLSAALGPWPVSGPALAAGLTALADTAWQARTRASLGARATRLRQLLLASGLDIIGGTSLFQLGRSDAAPALFQHLGRAGILVRRFPAEPTWLRFGLPADEQTWQKLQIAMAVFARRA
jgi:cobalamin biosynthesis protein CobC